MQKKFIKEQFCRLIILLVLHKPIRSRMQAMVIFLKMLASFL